MLEITVERALKRAVLTAGGRLYKFKLKGRKGGMDDLVLLPGGRVIFPECKRPKGGKLSAHQIELHKEFRDLGADVRVISTVEQAKAIAR